MDRYTFEFPDDNMYDLAEVKPWDDDAYTVNKGEPLLLFCPDRCPDYENLDVPEVWNKLKQGFVIGYATEHHNFVDPHDNLIKPTHWTHLPAVEPTKLITDLLDRDVQGLESVSAGEERTTGQGNS